MCIGWIILPYLPRDSTIMGYAFYTLFDDDELTMVSKFAMSFILHLKQTGYPAARICIKISRS